MPANRVHIARGTEVKVDIQPEYTILKIKELFEEKAHIMPDQVTLLFDGR
jgi:hypothetical protein